MSAGTEAPRRTWRRNVARNRARGTEAARTIGAVTRPGKRTRSSPV